MAMRCIIEAKDHEWPFYVYTRSMNVYQYHRLLLVISSSEVCFTLRVIPVPLLTKWTSNLTIPDQKYQN
jgi:hypothetical protein